MYLFLVAVHGMSSYDVTGAHRRLESNEVIHKVNNNHDDDHDEQTVYVIEFESESNEKEESLQSKGKDTNTGEESFVVSNEISLK